MEPTEVQLLSEIIISTTHWAYLYDDRFNAAEQAELKIIYQRIPELIAQGASFNVREIELMTKAVIDFSHH